MLLQLGRDNGDMESTVGHLPKKCLGFMRYSGAVVAIQACRLFYKDLSNVLLLQ